ncbi:phosphate ABC transporter substrate-binding protein PstS [Rothia sp. P5764]|uniref:phosphate ABC transporter substrate-binding protein PstS n=1 Tax=unclassified Rothia (in: high G+C Gram-positive bacteria) TaxID=2689056 RepID=UPI003AD58A36
MKAKSLARWSSLAFVGALALTACGSDNATGTGSSAGGSSSSLPSSALTGVGASSQQAAITAWETGFANIGGTVQYSPDGSGAGREAFLAGGAAFAGSDRALKTEEWEKSKEVCGPDGAINIPVYISPVAIAFNLPGIDSLNLDGETMAKIFKGEITTWKDAAIASQNEGVTLPDTKITVVHRSDDSGTTENFTEYLQAASNGAWDVEADGNWPSQYSGESNKGTSGVVSTTSSTEGAITYADASAIGNLGKVNVKVGDDYVELSAETAAKAVELSERVGGMNKNDMAIQVNRTPEDPTAYPVVLVSYHIVCSGYSDEDKASLVKAYESYVVSEQGQKDAADAASSAPLTSALSTDAQKAVESITVTK